MSFSPEDIANRVFTPSAEGYHQGEVRDFLQRVAREVRSLHAAYAAQSSNDGPLVPLPGGESTSNAIADDTVSGADDSDRLAAISDRLEALIGRLEGVAHAEPTVIGLQDAVARTPAQPAAPPARQDLATPTGQATVIDRAPTERVPVVVEEAPTRRAAPPASASTPLPRVPSEKLTAPLGSISPADPMFSDSANDLLDGVLDDVMGTLGDD